MFITIPALARANLFQMLRFSNGRGVYAGIKSAFSKPSSDKQHSGTPEAMLPRGVKLLAFSPRAPGL